MKNAVVRGTLVLLTALVALLVVQLAHMKSVLAQSQPAVAKGQWAFGFRGSQIPYGRGDTRGSLNQSSHLTFNDSTNVLTSDKVAAALNGTVGATTPASGAFTTLSASSTLAVTGAATLSSTLGVTGAITGSSTATAAGIYSTDYVTASTVGKGLRVKEGSNAKMGTGTFNGSGWVTITDSSVTSTSRIFVSGQTSTGAAYVKLRSAGVSFSVYSTDSSDSGDFAYLLVEPAP